MVGGGAVGPTGSRVAQPFHHLQATDPPPGKAFRRVDGADGFELWVDPGGLTPPEELVLEVRGWRIKRVEAYWNGCVFVV